MAEKTEKKLAAVSPSQKTEQQQLAAEPIAEIAETKQQKQIAELAEKKVAAVAEPVAGIAGTSQKTDQTFYHPSSYVTFSSWTPWTPRIAPPRTRTRIEQEHWKDTKILRNDERKQSFSEDKSTQTEQRVEPVQIEDKIYSLSKSESLRDERDFLEELRNNEGKIVEMIRNKQIPKPGIMKAAINQDGYSKGVQLALHEMSMLVKTEISQAVDVWCGYAPEDPHTPVFVVTLKNQRCVQKKNEIKELFVGYTIIIRHKYVPNDEEKSIVDRCGSQMVKSEDVARVSDCITTHTEKLMKEHSKLSIIRPCSVKTCGYLRKDMKVIDDTCIVFSVPVKGIIPVGEKEFPRVIDGIVTDVREGEFLFFGAHNAMEYHRKLRMGCCITGEMSGSLGGFVDLPGEKVGCLTCAHVVLTQKQIETYIQMGEGAKSLNGEFAKGNMQIHIHQPTQQLGLEPFGRVHTIALEPGNIFTPSVDAAIIQITDDDRKPETGNFPDGDFESIGFTQADPMFYTSGDILDDIEPDQRGSLVIKFGCKTGITRGYMQWIGESVRQVDPPWDNYCFSKIWGQWEVSAYTFAEPGDSGALVFLCSGGNIRNLQAVGMIMGGSSTGCSTFITPIKAVFEKLGLINNKFRMFPSIKLSPQEETCQQITKRISAHDHASSEQKSILDSLSEKVNTIENNMSQAFLRVEENMIGRLTRVEQNMNESIAKVEQNMNESIAKVGQDMNNHLSRIGDLLKDLSDK